MTVAVFPICMGTPVWAAKPKKGGHFRLGVASGASTDSLDPGQLPSTAPQVVHMQLRNCLVELDYKYRPIPELAESWEPSKDAAKWIFKLRKGVEFHNGKTLDAEKALLSTGPPDFDPCRKCNIPCRKVCPQDALKQRIYSETKQGSGP